MRYLLLQTSGALGMSVSLLDPIPASHSRSCVSKDDMKVVVEVRQCGQWLIVADIGRYRNWECDDWKVGGVESVVAARDHPWWPELQRRGPELLKRPLALFVPPPTPRQPKDEHEPLNDTLKAA